MGKIARCGFYAALFAVFSTVLFTGSSASAASDWDNSVEMSTFPDSFEVSDPNGDNTIFIGDRWYDIAYNEEEGFTSRNRGGNTLAGARNKINELNDIVVGNTAGQYLWVHEKLASGQSSVIVYFTNNLSANLIPAQSGTYNFNVSPPAEWSAIMWYDNGFGRRVMTYNNTSNSSSGIPVDMRPALVPGMRYLTLATDNLVVDYPIGYEGEAIEGANNDDSLKSYKPNITWEYDDLDVSFYSDHSKNTANVPPNYKIYWFFSNATFDTVQPTEPFAVSGCTSPAFLNEYTVPEYFDYGLQAYYADNDCNILSEDQDGNILSEQMEVLHIDGSTSSGSSQTDSDYVEDSELVKAIKNISIDQHGLQSLVLAPAQLFTQMATWNGQCSSINLPFIEGKNLSLQCVRSGFSSQYPVIYGTIQLVFSGLIAYFVAIKTFAVIKGANDPEDDKVETYKL